MGHDVETRRGGGLRLAHGVAVVGVVVVGVVVALWVLSALAHVIMGVITAVVVVAAIAGLVWLVTGRGRRHRR